MPSNRPATAKRRCGSRAARWRQLAHNTAALISHMTLTAALVRERVHGTILERIGDTPLVPLRRIGAGLRGQLWAKIESANPGGSVKDRAGLWMVIAAEEEGRLRDGAVILDATRCNTAAALPSVCAV